MSRLLTFTTLTIFLLSLLPLTTAQDDLSDWPVIERCVGEPTAPPDDWMFEGTIFLRNYDGIRGLNADFDTTYIIVFGDEFLAGAAPSPDGHWYAVPSGRSEYATMINRFYHVNEIQIFSTDGRRDTYRVTWGLSWQSGAGWITPLVWLDEQHLIYNRSETYFSMPTTWIVNPFTGEEESWTKNLKDLKQAELGPVSPINSITSPDLTRTIYNDWQRGTFQDDWSLYNFETGEVIASLPFQNRNVFSLKANSRLVWRPDSSSFATWADSVNSETDDPFQYLTLFDREGNAIDILVSAPTRLSGSLKFSPDNNLLSFFTDNHWYVADLQNRHIIDTCLESVADFTWSSDSKQAVFNYRDKIVVINLETHQSYIIGNYAGTVTGWRVD